MLLILALFSVGCVANDPYAFESQQRSQKIEGDAMTRAVLGLPREHGLEPLSGPMGGGVGNNVRYMEQQEVELKAQLGDSGVSVERDGQQIRLVMPGNITFGSDSHSLAKSFVPVLDAVVGVLSRFDDTALEVSGHTDSRGKEAYNMALSKQRAAAVVDYLVSGGVDSARIKTVGRGENQPLASNKDDKGRAANRRVELSIQAR